VPGRRGPKLTGPSRPIRKNLTPDQEGGSEKHVSWVAGADQQSRGEGSGSPYEFLSLGEACPDKRGERRPRLVFFDSFLGKGDLNGESTKGK